MFKIAICDDDIHICSLIEKFVLEYAKSSILEISIEVFYTGESLIHFIRNEYSFDLIFLDIELGTMTGVEIGKKIRNEFEDYISKIIYVSGTTSYDRQLFAVQPFNFIEKPISKQKIYENIAFAIKVSEKENRFFKYKSNYEIKHVPIKDILYFESKIKKIKIVTLNTEDYFYGNLEDIKGRLSKIFISTHRSYLVNYLFIERIANNSVYLKGLEIGLPISKRKLKEVRELQISLEKEFLDGSF